ncbi:MAG: hypothetical protein WCS32_07410 [Candidatus Izemoplasmatales bacterium]|jgi:hypothetical protein
MTEKEFITYISELKDKVTNLKSDVFSFPKYEQLLIENISLLNNLIEYRKATMREEDFENKLLLATELFKNYSDDDRIIVGRIIIDIEKFGESEKRMEKYENWFDSEYLNQKLFLNYKKLKEFTRENDDEGLVDFSKIEREYKSGNHFKHKSFYYKSIVQDQVLEQLLREDTFNAKEYPFYIKLDNLYYSNKRDKLPTLTEAEINPSNPKWTRKFTIAKGFFEGACYELLEDNIDEPNEIKKIFKDKDFLNGVRRIESIARRENNGRFSMMIEELSFEDEILVGRCIHLDSLNPVGTNFDDVILEHIDYAINIYGKNYDRLESRLDKKEKFDAVLRGHLFRIEKYPFYQLPKLTYLLFKSKLLTEDFATKTFYNTN